MSRTRLACHFVDRSSLERDIDSRRATDGWRGAELRRDIEFWRVRPTGAEGCCGGTDGRRGTESLRLDVDSFLDGGVLPRVA